MFLEFLASVPDAVWAALMASSVTLLGVALSNRHYSKQQKLEREHQSREASSEREFQMRRSVYLEAAAELTTAFQHLSNLPYIDSAKTNVAKPLDEYFVAASKATLVASSATAKLLNEFMTEYARVFLSAVLKTSPIQDARTDRDIQNNLYDSAQVEVKRLLKKSSEFNESASSDPEEWQVLQDNLNFWVEQSNTAAAKRDEAWGIMNSLSASFLVELLPEIKKLGALAAPVYVGIRKEIGLDSDLEEIQRNFAVRFDELAGFLEGMIEQLENEPSN